jgi:hypothetical protein
LKVDDPAVLADLFAFFDTGETKAAEALCCVGPAALPKLIERLQQGPAELREQLLHKAEDLRRSNPHLEGLLPGVLACLKHENDEVRRAALSLLRRFERRSAEGAGLVKAMLWRARDRKNRRDAITVLARISPDPEAVAAAFAEVQKDRDAEVRAAVPAALEHLGLSPEGELELLRVALRDEAESVRNAAAYRARSLGPAAIGVLPDLLRSLDGPGSSDWGRGCVIRALEAMGTAAAPALEAARAKNRAGGRGA